MVLHYLLPLHTLLSEGFFSSFHACALSAAAHLASSRIFSSFHAFALSAAARHHLVQKKRYLNHDSTGLAAQHKNQSSKALNPPPFQGTRQKWPPLAAAGAFPHSPHPRSALRPSLTMKKNTCSWSSRFTKLAPTDNFRDRSQKAQGKKVQWK